MSSSDVSSAGPSAATDPERLAEALVAAVGAEHVRPGGALGHGLTARPADTDEVAAVLRAAGQAHATVLPVGGASTVDWLSGPPVDVHLELGRMDAVLEHAAGDLVVHVQAGARLTDLQAALAPHGQRLAVSSPLPTSTIGGLVAADLSGPERYQHGTVRDLMLGTTTVAGDATVARSGGKVVKNVAGYDLGKLYTGSRGTLGVLTDAWFRLRPLPEAVCWVSTPAPGSIAAAAALAAVRGSQVSPTALQLHRDPDGATTVAVQLEGVAAGLAARAETVAQLLGVRSVVADTPPPGWGALPDGEVLLKLAHPPTALPAVLDALAAPGLAHQVRGSVGVGVLKVGCTGADAPVLLDAARASCTAVEGSALVLRAPAGHQLDVWGPLEPALLRLMHRVKNELDPSHTLAPGRGPGGT
ncbi:FAD-binding oxidoreductase [Rhodococcus sp. X156]|uniref:FAD-binding oxidoreductase n=1 Tax=Rhodococcus sp. X156 TaxID=2499145 RepID=UPI000FD90D76|nr:FAD-binding oxidoreductase [Rhodococcus sp. X156]